MSTPNVGQGGRFVPRVGAVVAGKYRIERKLGEGGMGLVVAASHLTLGGQVALKFLTTGDEIRPEAVTRFTREAQSVTRIKSEHIARVLDMGTVESGAPYIVMELLEGLDLHKFVRRKGPLPIADAVEFILQAAEGIAEAHAVGIVHRDLKPANLFLSYRPDGSPFVRVLDFGIAKNLQVNKEAGDVSLTVGTDVLGSPNYMAPEQIRNPKDVDPRADIWSLGAILYKLLTGRTAFEADNPSATLAMIVMEEAEPVRLLRPDVPPQLEAIVQRCLEKKIDRRFQTVDELACALLPFAPPRPRGRPWTPTTVLAPPVLGPPADMITSQNQTSPSTISGSSKSNPPSVRSNWTTAAVVAILTSAVIVVMVLVARAWIARDAVQAPIAERLLPSASIPMTIAEKPSLAEPKDDSAVIPAKGSPSIAIPSPSATASAITTKPTQRPTKTNALDDRL
jgi:eukaryotic-like serine/threonine-protein kinase